MTEALWRIGELSKRVGLSPQVLRAWENRYSLLEPQRSAGGYRLYSARDEARVRRVLALQAQGMSTAEAARLARSAPPATEVPSGAEALRAMRSRLLHALLELDEAEAHAALDALFASVDLDTAVVRGILPVLVSLGERWASGQISVAGEHYATNIIQARLQALARGWGEGEGRQALLACAPGELHSIGPLAFGLLLRRRGWRVAYLGASTPIDSVQRWVREHHPDAVVISAVMADRFVAVQSQLRELAAEAPLLLAGAGASPALARAVGGRLSEVDPVAAAEALTDGVWD